MARAEETGHIKMKLPTLDISLWLAFTSILLLITSELTSHSDGQTDLIINRQRLKNTGITLGLLFPFTVAIKIYQIISL